MHLLPGHALKLDAGGAVSQCGSSITFRDAYEEREAEAERLMVKVVRRAAQMAQLWAAGMTQLEREYQIGRVREPRTQPPRVVVQIDARDSDITIHPPSTPRPIRAFVAFVRFLDCVEQAIHVIEHPLGFGSGPTHPSSVSETDARLS